MKKTWRVGIPLLAMLIVGVGVAGGLYAWEHRKTQAEKDTKNPLPRCLQTFREGNLEEAHDACRLAIGENPREERAYVTLAEVYLAAGQIDYAVNYLQQLLKFAPNHPRAWFLLGRSARLRGQNLQAKTFYQNALIYAGQAGDEDLVRETKTALETVK